MAGFGNVSMQSGAPINIVLGGNNVSSVIPNSANRPDLVGPIKYTKQFCEHRFPMVRSVVFRGAG